MKNKSSYLDKQINRDTNIKHLQHDTAPHFYSNPAQMLSLQRSLWQQYSPMSDSLRIASRENSQCLWENSETRVLWIQFLQSPEFLECVFLLLSGTADRNELCFSRCYSCASINKHGFVTRGLSLRLYTFLR